MIRSGGESVVIESFDGINDLIEEIHLPAKFAPLSFGGYYDKQRQFRRLAGKTLVSSTTTAGGSVLTIQQLEFRERVCIVYHASTGYRYESDLSNLNSSRSNPNPLEPMIAP